MTFVNNVMLTHIHHPFLRLIVLIIGFSSFYCNMFTSDTVMKKTLFVK